MVVLGLLIYIYIYCRVTLAGRERERTGEATD